MQCFAAISSIVLMALTPPAQAEEVVVFAAASLRTALDQVAQEFQATTGHSVLISYAGSSVLAKQILQGAPADIFISAAEPWMDVVAAEGLIADGNRRALLGNSLVLIAHDPNAAPVEVTPALDLSGLLGGEKLAMALTNSVPAGEYGKAALQSLGLWSKIEPSVAQADNVRAALALVATGEAPLGIVYATDAVAEPLVKVIGQFPPDSHPPITYPAALLTMGTDAADLLFFNSLTSESAQATFAAQGFEVLK